MHAFKIPASVLLFALSVLAQKEPSGTPGSAMPVVTMMWGDSKPTNAALAASAESAGSAMSSQMATAEAEMNMSGMPMPTSTTKAMSAVADMSMSGMSGMSMETASATGMMMGGAPQDTVWGAGVAMVMVGVGAALVV
ncbi:hypothetical protein P171DRAFT_469135 [Karstenula rhodostoma CBS 690.94]|uniref:Uncharacterized protein n=1 Tax=Karstenula rhodostoma CBS 690.94 TaxID=1392251 RepID=A0A9P4PX86_9PLEO|nr:hypothetical protein P171DRAFT_469135 [Karstenula rhodostoma CBS 690.94]